MDATVTPPEAIAEPGHNSGNRLKAFLDDVVVDLGRQSARGTTALSDLAIRVIEAAHDGVLQPQAAKAIYERYAEASKSAGGTVGSVKSNTSKIKKLIELGCLPDGLRIAEEAMGMRDGVDNPKSVFEGLVEVARLRQAKDELTNDEIKMVLAKAPKQAKPKPAGGDASPGWQDVAKHINALVSTKDRAGLEAAIAIRDQIDSYVAEVSEEIHGAEAA
jgi:hypothetical protein